LFGSHRGSGVAFWARSLNGNLERLYVVADGTGVSIGDPNELELKWNLVDLTPGVEMPPKDQWDKYLYPGEKEVLQMAAHWSISPSEISKFENVGSGGVAGKLK